MVEQELAVFLSWTTIVEDKSQGHVSGADLGILRGGGGVLGRNSSRGVRVQVRRNFHILASKKKYGGG